MTPQNDSSNGNPLYEKSYTGLFVTVCIALAVGFAIYMMSGHNNRAATKSSTAPTTTGSAALTDKAAR
jgi:hypothetical protein